MKNATVLLVDDSKSALLAIEGLLGRVGIRAVKANDGIEGQAALQKERFDLVITDVDMPNLNGLDFCHWIKSNPQTANTPVIVLSARESDHDIEEGFRVGADAYVPKSAARKELIPRIEAVMNRCTYVKNKTVLVVEDSQAIREVTRKGLEAADFNVVTAEDGRRALDMIAGVSPDILLTDLNMPNLGGGELCRKLCGMDQFKLLPIVVMSTMSDKPTMQRLIQDGVLAFIVKPFNINMLVMTLERILSDQFQRMMEERERLRHEQKLTLGSITSLVNALEARDTYTRGHSESVTKLSASIGRELGFGNAEMARLVLAGRLHDLGKIGVRDNVLLKPGKLTAEEFDHIKTHTVVVQNILAPLSSMDDVLLAASSHHERWDGTGYPWGLREEEIPLLGRIIAVADVYDALTSDRPYRAGMPRDKALDIIAQGRGTHFCPAIVDAFLAYMDKSEQLDED